MKGEVPAVIKIAALVGASSFALSWGSKREVVRRNDGKCFKGGEHSGQLEAAHRDHTKDEAERRRRGLPPYNSPNSTDLLCTRHHLLQHISTAGNNGLTKAENDSAIRHLMERLNITDLSQL